MKIRIQPEDSGKRLDKLISEKLKEISRSLAKKLIESGKITINGKKTEPSYRVKEGNEVEIE